MTSPTDAQSAEASAQDILPPLNFIYSCSFCCATFAEIYDGHVTTVGGLSDGINPKDRLVTKLFLASCCHVICSKHLDGGAPPFHPNGERPKAACPTCVREKGEKEPRELFSVRGFRNGEYDAGIPQSWFVAPPLRLDGNGQEMEALRFQYLALIRYCQNVASGHHSNDEALVEAQKESQTMQDLASEHHARVKVLETENKQLRIKLEQEIIHSRSIQIDQQQLEKFKAQKPAIHHYLSLIPMILEQRERMQDRLAALGFAMLLEPIPSFAEPIPKDDTPVVNEQPPPSRGFGRRDIFTAFSPARFTNSSTAKPAPVLSSPSSRRPPKRQRLDSAQQLGKEKAASLSSQDAMPPPPKPLSRMASMRKMFPSIRKKGNRSQLTTVLSDKDTNVGTGAQETASYNQTSPSIATSSRSNYAKNTHIPGQTPSENQVNSPYRMHSLHSPSKKIYHDPERSGQASPRSSSSTKMSRHRPNRLPMEPSYMRIMDNLSQNDCLDLGIQDPRQAAPENRSYDGGHRQLAQGMHPSHIEDGPETADIPQHWHLGHPFLHQSPRYLSPTGYSGTGSALPGPTNNLRSITNAGSTLNPVTPSPSRRQPPAQQVESVVSPFFKSSHYNSHSFPRANITEPGNSSNPSGAYRSPGPVSQTRGHESRSLNGLSFFDSPLNAMNEPIRTAKNHKVGGQYEPPPHYSQASNFNARGFITRPGIERSSYIHDRDPRFHDQFSSRTAARQPSSPISFTSRHNAPNFFPKPLASTMPSLPRSRSSSHFRHKWDNMDRASVKSSRNSHGRFPGYASAAPKRSFFSGSGQRHMRR